MVKMIVDKNCLKPDKLIPYLDGSQHNYVLLTDYSAVESYKQGALEDFYKFIEVLSHYPSQVIILKNITTALALRGSITGMRRRLIEREHTKEFHLFCRRVLLQRDQPETRTMIQERQVRAQNQVEGIVDDIPEFKDSILEFQNMFDPAELKTIRLKEPYTKAIMMKVMKVALGFTKGMYVLPQSGGHPALDVLLNCFPYRLSVCRVAYALKKIAIGGIENKSTLKLANDQIDMIYITYATYFDGILTDEVAMREIYSLTKAIINAFSYSKFKRGFEFQS